MAELDSRGTTIQVGGLGLRTPRLSGTAEALDSQVGRSRLRSAGGASDTFQGALEGAGMRTTHVVELRAASLPGAGPRAGAAGAGRAARGVVDDEAIELDVPQPSEGWEQAVLSVDEYGVTTWSFAPSAERGPGVRGPGNTRTFKIKRTIAEPATGGAAANRSIFGEIGKQVLKVIAFRIGDLVGEAGRSYLDQWEQTHQGYGVRDFTADNYTGPAAYFNDDAARWAKLTEGRTLLFVHGTNSRAHGAFDALPRASMQELHTIYEGRVIAFDHQSLSRDPMENIDWLLDRMPEGLTLDLDIVCHSRGGLVSRSLAERTDPIPGQRTVRVHRTALVGATNNGTILADVKHWNDLVDMLSTVLNTVGIGVGDAIDLVLAFVRQIAVKAYPHLRGLACMVPSSDFLSDLNARPRGRNQYLAIASNYEPVGGNAAAYFRDVVTDRIFDEHANDGMVRIDSVCGNATPGAFAPVTETLLLPDTMGIEHSRYFGVPMVANGLVTWLGDGVATPV
jgi:hypothetical protein